MTYTAQRRFHFPGSDGFRAADRFVTGYEPANISYLGANFCANFLDIDVAAEPAGDYCAVKLTDAMTGAEIVEQFGAARMAGLAVAWHLLKTHHRDGSSALLTGGLTSILIPPQAGYSIGVFWFKGAWSIRAYPFVADKERRWFAGNQVILKAE